MIVENKWFAGVISIPLYIATFLSLSLVTSNIIAYIICGIMVLYISGVLYQRLVVNRVKNGISQSIASLQWLAIQLLILGAWYAAVSNIST
ncbi:hypothetical protein [uncultured Pseudoteredinibacter sp.]|uniref:hypothetical protein n=1 Tax=uncultured Pseudoteredinibacter sp. TaxID=1641701 RepID=UPI00262CA01B|nr:hypothetical protein [uncultured Pseudoteredinibacter sp.]